MRKSPKKNFRSREQLWNHYLVEKSIAERLKRATTEERKQLYASMYDELFERVPDHPRLKRRSSKSQTLKSNRRKMTFLRRFLKPDKRVAEFGAGDCEFSFLVSENVLEAIAIDISDQIATERERPPNFRQVIYDGFFLQAIPDNHIDVLFSNQLIEHFHPEETLNHFRIAYRILKPNGVYAFKTPHAMSGPHDVSKYFSDKAEGFHLKEWTYRELGNMLSRAGFSSYKVRWTIGELNVPIPKSYVYGSERFLSPFRSRLKRKLSSVMLPTISIVAVK